MLRALRARSTRLWEGLPGPDGEAKALAAAGPKYLKSVTKNLRFAFTNFNSVKTSLRFAFTA